MPINHAPFPLKGRRTVLLADGVFSTFGAKTAVCYLRYRGENVVAVVDRGNRGKRVADVLGFGGEVPVVADVGRSLAYEPKVAIVGVAPRGGQIDGRVRAQVVDSLRNGIDVVSGLHTLLADDPEIVKMARSTRTRIWDVRRVPEGGQVGTGRGCVTGAKCVLVTGSDCNVGKMTAAVELYREAKRRGLRAAWAATGQTGMMIRERGIAIDRVVGDFMSGAAEELLNFEGKDRDLVFVEGQGSLVHPGYAGVTLGLTYGVMPDCQIMVHAAGRQTMGDAAFPLPVPPLEKVIELHESIMRPFKRSPVVAVALNTVGLEPAEACDMIERTKRETALAVADPIRDGAGTLLDAIIEYLGLDARAPTESS